MQSSNSSILTDQDREALAAKTLYIFRHGLATHSKSGYGEKILSAEILEEGKPAIRKLSQFLTKYPFDVGFTSPVKRCMQTIEIVTDITGYEFEPDNRITEFHLEGIDDVRERAESFLHSIAKMSSEHIYVCSHGTVIAAMQRRLLNQSFESDNILEYPHCGGLRIIHQAHVDEIDFNEH